MKVENEKKNCWFAKTLLFPLLALNFNYPFVVSCCVHKQFSVVVVWKKRREREREEKSQNCITNIAVSEIRIKFLPDQKCLSPPLFTGHNNLSCVSKCWCTHGDTQSNQRINATQRNGKKCDRLWCGWLWVACASCTFCAIQKDKEERKTRMNWME